VNGRGLGFGWGRPWVLVVLVAASILLAAGLAINLLDDTTGDVSQNTAFVEAIQEERARATRENCRIQNAQNRNTVARVRERYRLLSPTERREGRESRDYTIALIDALAPVRDCKKLVKRTVVDREPD
jgi:hypothetical protein